MTPTAAPVQAVLQQPLFMRGIDPSPVGPVVKDWTAIHREVSPPRPAPECCEEEPERWDGLE